MPMTQQFVYCAYMKDDKPTERSKVFGFDIWEETEGEEIPFTRRNPCKFAIRQTYKDGYTRLLLPQGNIPEPELTPLVSDMNAESENLGFGCSFSFEKIKRAL